MSEVSSVDEIFADDNGLRNVRLIPEDGALLVLDVVDERVACVELLDRHDVREKLLAVVP